MTAAVRRAANVAALAVIVYAGVWLLTTQVRSIREMSPFAVDPWDAVASYAAIFLPVVAGATWIRSLRHREHVLPATTARRIVWGCGLALGIVATADLADLGAILGEPSTAPLITGLVIASTLATGVAFALLVPASRRLAAASPPASADATEPDVVDDLLGLGADVGGRIGLGQPIEGGVDALQRFLERSAVSPRRHRLAFGALVAIASAAMFAAWVGFREGGWADPSVPIVVATLWASAVLAIYVGTLGPLRLLRPPLEQTDGAG